MVETELHRNLVSALVSEIAKEHGEVTHAVAIGTFADPPAIGRHEPDVLAEGLGGTVVIGEAKTGPDLFEERSLEQFEDFTRHTVDGETASLVLMVPAGFEADTRSALEQAGADAKRVSVIELVLPPRQSKRQREDEVEFGLSSDSPERAESSRADDELGPGSASGDPSPIPD